VRALRRTVWAVTAAAALIVAAGCSSSSSGGAGGGSSAAGSTAASGSSGASSAGLEAATQAVAAAIKQSSTLGITTPLTTIPRGKRVDFLQCGVSDCTHNGEFLEKALDQLGIKLNKINSGSTTQQGIAALQQAVADKPDGIIFGATDLAPLQPELDQLAKLNIPVVTFANSGAATGAVKITFLGDAVYGETGKLAADWIIRDSGGQNVNVAYLNFPVYSFSAPEVAAFTAELAKNCTHCSMHVIPNQPSDVGTTLQTRVTSYLQANTGTKYLYDSAGGAFLTGVPAALSTAGVTGVKVASCCPSAGNFADIKNGSEAMTIDLSAYQAMWYCADAIAREMTGQGVAGIVDQDLPWNLIIDKSNVDTIDFDKFPTGPGPVDMEAQFEKLWGTSTS
jgi:ABC-type sugar transport system substrate-binding protein